MVDREVYLHTVWGGRVYEIIDYGQLLLVNPSTEFILSVAEGLRASPAPTKFNIIQV